jgi:hypothetical protein
VSRFARTFIRYVLLIFAWLCAAPCFAVGHLYEKTDNGWYIYKEDKSCVAYIDFPDGMMLRFSNRADENRMYFSIFSENWEHLSPLEGQTITLSLKFLELRRNHGTMAGVIRNLDGRMGFSGADLSNSDILLALAGSPSLDIAVLYSNSRKEMVVASLNLKGGQLGVLHLNECTEKHFSK